MADPFITEQDVVDLLGRGDTSDPGITIAVDAACDIVRTFTERLINETTESINLDGHGGDALLLPQLPVTQVVSVQVNGTAVTDYAVGSNGILYRGTGGTADTSWAPSNWPEGRQNITVQYKHGWAGTLVPRDLRMVALALAQRIVVQGAAVSEQVGQTRVAYAGAATDLTKTEKIILGKYKHIR